MTGVAGASVEFQQVTKRFPDRDGRPDQGPLAVDSLSLTVQPGGICVLVGPSGCGKTTTLKMVNRLEVPTSGRILLDGRDIAALDVVSLRRHVGYVIQQIGLFPHQTIADNVATVPRLLGWPRERIHRRVDELLDLIGLDPDRVRRRYPAQLSGGERQRVGVARALAAEPPLLLMDEPFGAVDPIVRARLQDEFLRLQRRLGTTVLFVTHDIDEAVKLGSTVAVMQEGGQLAQHSPPADLLARPASDYVARFVGADRALKRLALVTAGELQLEALSPNLDRGTLPAIPAMTPARDALSLLLTASGQRGVVVEGREPGLLTLEAVAAAMRSVMGPEAPTPTPPPSLGEGQAERATSSHG